MEKWSTYKKTLFPPRLTRFPLQTTPGATSITSFLKILPESLCIYKYIPMCEYCLLTCRLVPFPFLSMATAASIAQDGP